MNLEQQAQRMTSYMLAMRRMQDKTEMAFLASLGGLTLPQLNVLNVIGDNPVCTMGDIAKRVNLSLSSVTLIIEKLVKGKLVNRIRSETDRRIVYAELTLEGEKIYQIQIEHLNLVSHKMLSLLSTKEQAEFLAILQKLTVGLVKMAKQHLVSEEPDIS
jgi:MarR family transcriptional regulator, organic hydroperoxide resistance regulator